MKKLALCALVLGAGLAASRADVSLGIRIGIDDRHDHHADHRSSTYRNHYPVRQPRYVPPPPTVVRYETVVVTYPGYGPVLEQRPVYAEPAACPPPPQVCAEPSPYVVVAAPAYPPRGRGW